MSGDFEGLTMQRIAIAVVLSGLLAACGQPSQPKGKAGAPAQLDYIDAVPISEDDWPPVVQPQAPAKKDAARTERDEAVTPAAEAIPAPAAQPTPPPQPTAAAPVSTPPTDAASATRRANEAVAPRSPTEVPYSPN